MPRLRTSFLFFIRFSTLLLPIHGFSQTPAPGFPKEAVVVEKISTEVRFAPDGTGERAETFVIRVQSDTAVRDLGVLAYPYNAANETLEFVYVRVRKADGSVIPTPSSLVQDLPSQVSRVAPTYSDLREKQVPVRSLSAGDVLEYQVRAVRTKPDVPNQFWYSHDFTHAVIVLDETLRITVPANRYIKLKSPALTPETREENGQKTYIWKSSNLKTSAEEAEPSPTKKPVKNAPAHSVQLTTFHSWDEVGLWYGELEAPQVRVTPAIRAKALELTKDATTNDQKERALYDFVSARFRYVSVSFGSGRYQPHTPRKFSPISMAIAKTSTLSWPHCSARSAYRPLRHSSGRA
ncbi:MAG: DUF3857 domain-containing protein [Acidobacteriota bacterium]|nr:DUF3857 domain-containing protein [Acidobacteriota bacterium]